MPLIGKIIKKVVDVTSHLAPNEDALEAQDHILEKLLTKAADTAFGKRYQFDKILESEDIKSTFAARVPLHDYYKISEEWWNQQMEGKENVTWPGKTEYFAVSAGTTGNTSKKIPVTKDMLDAIRETGVKQAFILPEFDLPEEFYQSGVLMLGSSTNLKKEEDHLEGEISGITANNLPFWFKRFYKPEEEIAAIDNWDERVRNIAKKAPEWDIGALSGIPSWMELMLKEIVSYNKLNTIHDIWPNLSVFTSGGTAFGPYRKSMEKLFAKPLIYLDTYLASEGFLAYQKRANDEMAMSLAYDTGIYFEFIPFVEKYFDDIGAPLSDAEVIPLRDVEENKEYAIIISSVSGAWRYSVGDTVKITNKEKSEILITGRTKHFMNVVGSQMSVNNMNEALQEMEKKFNISIPEFTMSAVKVNDKYIHRWYLGVEESSAVSEDSLSKALDEALKSNNKSYLSARGKALTGIEVRIIPKAFFYDWAEKEKKKGGQIKTPRMMKEEQFQNWEGFVASKLMT